MDGEPGLDVVTQLQRAVDDQVRIMSQSIGVLQRDAPRAANGGPLPFAAEDMDRIDKQVSEYAALVKKAHSQMDSLSRRLPGDCQNDGQQEAALRDVTSQCEAESEGLEQDLAEAEKLLFQVREVITSLSMELAST